MAREIGDRKLTCVDETKYFRKSRKQFALFFHDLEPGHMNAVDACKVSKVWVV